MSTKKLCAMGLLVALTCVATMIIQIPIPATQGYVNIGDSIVLISAIFFGPQVGFVAGGLGSGLADLLWKQLSVTAPLITTSRLRCKTHHV